MKRYITAIILLLITLQNSFGFVVSRTMSCCENTTTLSIPLIGGGLGDTENTKSCTNCRTSNITNNSQYSNNSSSCCSGSTKSLLESSHSTCFYNSDSIVIFTAFFVETIFKSFIEILENISNTLVGLLIIITLFLATLISISALYLERLKKDKLRAKSKTPHYSPQSIRLSILSVYRI